MGFIGSFLGKIAAEMVMETATTAKQRFDEKKVIDEANTIIQREEITKGSAFRLPDGFCEGANGKVWRVAEICNGKILLKRRRNGKEHQQWFDIKDILEYHEAM